MMDDVQTHLEYYSHLSTTHLHPPTRHTNAIRTCVGGRVCEREVEREVVRECVSERVCVSERERERSRECVSERERSSESVLRLHTTCSLCSLLTPTCVHCKSAQWLKPGHDVT